MSGGPYRSARREIVMSEYAFLRPWGLSRQQIADRLGIQEKSLIRQLRLAAEHGDSRSDWSVAVPVVSA